MLQFDEDVVIKSRLTLINILKEYMLKQLNPESNSKIIDLFNEITDTFTAAIR